MSRGFDHSAGHERNTQGLEVFLPDSVQMRSLVMLKRAAGDIDTCPLPPPDSRRVCTGLTRTTPGSLCQLVAHAIDIRLGAIDRVSSTRRTDGGVGQVLAVEADVHPLQVLQRSAEESGGHERREAQRDLDRHQRRGSRSGHR